MLAVQPDQMSTTPSQIENHDVAAARKASHVVRLATPSGWRRREPKTAAHDNLCRSLCVALSLLVLLQPSDSPSRGLTPVPEAGWVYPRRASVDRHERYHRPFVPGCRNRVGFSMAPPIPRHLVKHQQFPAIVRLGYDNQDLAHPTHQRGNREQ